MMAEDKKKVDLNQEAQDNLDNAKEVETINRVIAGQNDIFKKEYKFDELGLEFTIKIKYPNALEQGKIHAQTALYFDGLSRFMPENLMLAYTTLSSLRVCGIDIPDFLKNDEDIYNINILMVIGKDYGDWLDSFRY